MAGLCRRPMMTRFAMGTAAVLLGCGCAHAQARMNVAPLPALGMTSPFGIPNAPVGHTGIPMGATELATPGVSPITSGASPVIGATCAGVSSAGVSAGMGGPMTGASAGIASSIPGLSTAPRSLTAAGWPQARPALVPRLRRHLRPWPRQWVPVHPSARLEFRWARPNWEAAASARHPLS